jgi:TPR repeat protein
VPNPSTILLAVAASLFTAAIAACDRDRGSSGSPQEAPSASVLTLGVSLGACDDLATCARECDAGSADRCRRLAVSYALGQTAPKNEVYATSLYEQACSMGDPAACVFAGQMHEYAHGVPKDDRAAAGFYETSCKLGWAVGCYNLAIMTESGRGLPADRSKAAELYGVACKAGATQACDKESELRALPAGSGPARPGSLP